MRKSGAHSEQDEAHRSAQGAGAARRETSTSAAVPPPLTADALQAAQRGGGNTAVTAMIARRVRPTPAAEEQPDPGVHQVLRSAGKPLSAPVRQDMESRFETDFSDVRLHTGAAAARSARAIGARAYTSGSHVVLGPGGGDKHTLAHELTHVVQQRQGPVSGTDHGNGLKVSDPSDAFERAAEANAHKVMSGPAPDVQRHAETGPEAAPRAEAVQRTVQDHLSDAHWKEQAAGKKSVKAPAKPSKGRTGDDILRDIGPKLIEDLAKKCAGKSEDELAAMGRLDLFRSMPAEEAAEIKAWWGGDGHQPAEKLNSMNDWIMEKQEGGKPLAGEFNKTFGETKKTAVDPDNPKDGILPVANHLGDEEQARTYYTDPAKQVLMKFTLRPGAHELLFHPDHMAVVGESKGRTPQHLRDIHGGMPQGKKGEGKLEGYIGIKQEKPREYEQDEAGNRVLKEGRGDFSLSLGTKWSRLLFQLFVEHIEAVS